MTDDQAQARKIVLISMNLVMSSSDICEFKLQLSKKTNMIFNKRQI